MEADISHLTADIADVRVAQRETNATLRETNKTVADLRERMARAETKIDTLPTKDFVVKTFPGGFGTLLAMMTFMTLFQGKLQQLFGLATIVAT